ncbi:MAG: chorismate mutase [Candidatus Eisenbacteria bacterium]|nr:chorismate mutase [Candidatus Eisenbacteria bacterium]
MSADTPSTAPTIAAVRGAVQVRANTAADVLEATTRLLVALLDANRLAPERVVSAVFTTTEDLDADFPAHAARRLGWSDVPMLNAREIPVPGAMERVVRVLLTVRDVPRGARLVPVYLDGAAALRPDLVTRAAPAASASARRLALIGLGQIGGSIGLSLAGAPGWHRVGFDADAVTAGHAFAAGAVDELAPTLAAACAGAEIAVIATPVDTLAALVEAAAAALPPGAALLDTGSARGPVTPALRRAAARGIAAVGGHPSAGHEGRGFAAARAGLFAGAAFALLPVRGAVPDVVQALVRDLGARPVEVEPEAHDRALARTSHLPYLMACALRRLGGAEAARDLAGSGFRDMTRLAASDPRMAEAYCRANAREVAGAWRLLRDALDRRIAALGEA